MQRFDWKETIKEAIPKVAFVATLVPALLQLRRYGGMEYRTYISYSGGLPLTLRSASRFLCAGFLARTVIEKAAGEAGQPLVEKPPSKMFNNTTLLTWTATNTIAFAFHPAMGFAAVFTSAGCEAARAYTYGVKKIYQGN